jgi:hypothetical protein
VKTKPNIDAFLDGGAATERGSKRARETEPESKVRSTPEPAPTSAPRTEFRKQMVMQLPIGLINDLKRRALELSVESGKRVTQQQLVEEALRKHLYGR